MGAASFELDSVFIVLDIPPETLALMCALRRVFDPNGILNSEKKLPNQPSAA